MATNFSDAKLSISGEEMRDIIQRTAKFGIDNYVSMQRDCTNNWSFRNSFFFAGTGKNVSFISSILSNFSVLDSNNIENIKKRPRGSRSETSENY